jgi:predicted phage terminase large subunit-like protein
MNSLPSSKNYSPRPLPTLEQVRAERIRRATSSSVAATVEQSRERSRTLAGFVREAWHVVEPANSYIHGWHIDAICAHLEAVSRGVFLAKGLDNRLLINVPPGMMKSLLTSVFWPAWEWGPAGMPAMRYLTTSYAEHFARRDARKQRDLVQSDWYQRRWPEVALTRDAEMSFANSVGGSRDAVAFKSLTGGRGDRVILDDPHSTETAESDAERENTIRIFRESVTERLNDKTKSAIVVIMQRLHEKDVSGVIQELGLPYQHLMLPMEFEPERRCKTAIFTDPRTQDGELLFPERFPRAVVERDKKPMGAYAIAGQYQQRPSPRGGLLFKRHWFSVIPAAPASIRWVRGWDLAASKDAGAAYTAGVKLGKTMDGRFVIGHAVHIRETGSKVRELILNTAEQDGKNVTVDLPQDPGQAGKVQAQDLIAMLAGYTAFASPESGDKIARAEPVAAQAEAGNVSVVEGTWNDEFLAELETFPTGKFKDFTDALSRAFGRLVTNPAAKIILPILVTAPRTSLGDHPGA